MPGSGKMLCLTAFVWACFLSTCALNVAQLATSDRHQTLHIIGIAVWGVALAVQSFNLRCAWGEYRNPPAMLYAALAWKEFGDEK